MPSPAVPNFTALGSFASLWGTGYAAYTGPVGAKPVIPAGWELCSVATHAQDATMSLLVIREAKVAPVTVPVTPQVPIAIKPSVAVNTIKAPANGTRGIGITIGDATPELRDVCYDGFGTNIVIDSKNPVTLRNVRSINAYRDEQPPHGPERQYWGQGCYGYHCPALTVDSCYMASNGWQPGRPIGDKSIYRHGLYHGDEAGALTVVNSIFVGNAYAGVQARGAGPVVIRNSIFIGNSVGVLLKMPGATVEDCLFFDPDWAFQRDQQNREVWTDGIGVSAWGNGTVNNCLFVGRKRATPADGRKRNMPTPWMTGAGVTLAPTGCRVVQWAGPGVDYSPDAILADVQAGKVSVAEAVTKIRTDVTRLLP